MLRLSLFALIGIVSVGTDAGASTYHSRYHHRHRASAATVSYRTHSWRRVAYGGGEVVAHPVNCPATLFCGCGAAHELGLSDRSLWLVRSWYRFPRAAAAPGMAALWGTRHVAVIRAVNGDGTATVYDANSGGGLTRVHRVSLAGLTIVNPQGGSVPAANEPMPRRLYAAANEPTPRREYAAARRIAYRHHTVARYRYAAASFGDRPARYPYPHHTVVRYRYTASFGYRPAHYFYPPEHTWRQARADMFMSFAR
jgi:hypothetical protein